MVRFNIKQGENLKLISKLTQSQNLCKLPKQYITINYNGNKNYEKNT